MTVQTKKEYLKIVRKKYKSARNRKEKTKIICEVQENTGLQRKSVIRALNRPERKYRRKGSGRKKKYGYDLRKPLRIIWTSAGKPCSKNLKPDIPKLLKKLKQFNEIEVSDGQEKLLCVMSEFTIDRLLASERKVPGSKGLSGTRRSPHLKQLIPVRTNFDKDVKIGDLEIDCVLHCGESVFGIYAETLNMLDIKTMWNERRIFVKKTKTKVIGALHDARRNFPFEIKSIDFDNGFEFVNWCMYKYCKREKIDFTRSRSYHKNDQAHIEGRNNQAVRKIVGYARINRQEIVDLITDIYTNELRLLTNYFYPVRKLTEKRREGGKIVKKYDEAKTPYERVMKSKEINLRRKIKLAQEYARLNPAKLTRSLNEKLKRLNRLISVTDNYLATTKN